MIYLTIILPNPQVSTDNCNKNTKFIWVCILTHTYNILQVNIMLDRDTISRQELKSPNLFTFSIDSFMDCLERTKKVLENECNGDFKDYERCVDRALKILN